MIADGESVSPFPGSVIFCSVGIVHRKREQGT